MNELTFASISHLQTALSHGEVTSQDLMQQSIDRIHQHDEQIGAVLETFEPDTIPTPSSDKPLSQIPGLIKDNICQKQRQVTCASRILQGYTSPFDATAVDRLYKAGGYSIGRANCDEFAMGVSNETSAYHAVANPWDTSRVPGGSSGGSAAAVAAGYIPWALGSDTGGSCRQPASFCGVVGCKPTYGLVSRYGLVSYASSLDQIGVLSRYVYDNALVLESMAGHDTRDATSLSRVHNRTMNITQHLTGSLPSDLKIGVIDNAIQAENIHSEISSALHTALDVFSKLGASISYTTMSALDHAAAVYFMLSRAEAASNLARFDGVRYGYRSADATSLFDMYEQTRSQGLCDEVKRRILVGNYVLSSGHADEFYESAKIVQHMIRNAFLEAFKEFDLLFMPVNSIPAFSFGAYEENKLEMNLQDYFTAPANLAGIPAVSVPCGFVNDQLPIGFQLLGPDLAEPKLFQAAYAYEQATPWHTMHPKL